MPSVQVKSHLSLLMVNHYVVRFDISVHDTPRMAKVEGLEQLVDVIPYVVVGEAGVEYLEICVVDVLEDDGRGFTL